LKKCTYLSNVAAKIYFPFGEKRTKDTGGFSSSKNSKKREWNMDVYKDVPKKVNNSHFSFSPSIIAGLLASVWQNNTGIQET